MPKTAELKELSKRINRTVMERLSSMLSHAKLRKIYCAKALMAVIYVINRSPSTTLACDVPQRVWTGRDASYRHLRVFGCLAYIHVAKDKRGKLDPNTRLCIFIGCGEDEFSYRPWDLVDKKVIGKS